MESATTIRVATLEKVVIFEPIEVSDDQSESIKLRVEVFRWAPDRFTSEIWRRETYKLLPSFFRGAEDQGLWDAETYVLEPGLTRNYIEGRSVDEVLEAAIKAIELMFSVSLNRP